MKCPGRKCVWMGVSRGGGGSCGGHDIIAGNEEPQRHTGNTCFSLQKETEEEFLTVYECVSMCMCHHSPGGVLSRWLITMFVLQGYGSSLLDTNKEDILFYLWD